MLEDKHSKFVERLISASACTGARKCRKGIQAVVGDNSNLKTAKLTNLHQIFPIPSNEAHEANSVPPYHNKKLSDYTAQKRQQADCNHGKAN
jgi:hypothetical protein